MKFVQASHYTKGRTSKILFLVFHDMEMAEKPTTAEGCAAYFARDTTKASSHYTLDSDSEVQCVKDSDTAWCAPGANSTGLHFEHAGFASQSRGDWLDDFGKAMLARSARLFAAKCHEYGIPPRKGDYADIRAGRPCIVGHWDVTKAFPDKGSHTDPGSNFPWDYFIGLVKAAYDGTPLEEDMPLTDADAKKLLTETKVVPSLMLGSEDTVSVSRALDLMMRWSLEARNQATAARQVAEAAALKGSALTADEVKDAVKAALSETVELDISVKQSGV